MLLVLFITVFAAGCITPSTEIVSQKDITEKAAADIFLSIQETTKNMQVAADTISNSIVNDTIDTRVAKQALATLYQRSPLGMDMLVIDKYGNFVSVYPENNKYRQNVVNFEFGRESEKEVPPSMLEFYIGDYEERPSNSQKAIGSRIPIMKDGKYFGLVTLAYDPYDLFGKVQQTVSEYGLNLLVVQSDGVQIYDPDIWELGTNSLTNDAFKDIRPTIEEVLATNNGTETYMFYEDGGSKTVNKTICWTTLSYGGQNWTVATTAEPGMPKAISKASTSTKTPTSTKTSTTNTPAQENKNLTQIEVAKLAALKIKSNLEQNTDDLITARNELIAEIANDSISTYKAKQILANLYQRSNIACSVVLIDKNGKIISTYPNNTALTISEFGDGWNITTMLNAKDTYVSKYQIMRSGKMTIASVYPVEKDGTYFGFLYLDYDPYDLFGDVQQTVSEYGLNLMVVQTDGVEVYDPDVWELGKNTLNDPEFDEIREIVKKVVAGGEGEDTYEFVEDGGTAKVTKTISWTTLNYGGQSWAVAVTDQDTK